MRVSVVQGGAQPASLVSDATRPAHVARRPLDLSDLILAPFRLPAWETALLFAALGAVLSAGLTHAGLRQCDEPDRGWSLWGGLAGLLCCGLFAYCMLTWKVQQIDEVRPGVVWANWRIGHHVVLIALMLAVTATDVRAYLIPDGLTRCGVVWGVALAALSGDLQIEHVWVDWNQEIPQLQGPYLPAWLAEHPHWHGLAWSVAGAACGALGTWLIRGIATFALGQEAMGLGDVTLMAMIGAYLGWQPTLVVLLLAPLCGLLIGALWSAARGLRALAGAAIPALRPTGQPKSYLPYGPFLCLAAYVVLLTWGRIWKFELRLTRTPAADDRLHTFAVRRLFGDWVALLVIAAIMLAALMIVLLLRRIYRSLPVERRTPVTSGAPADTSASLLPSDSPNLSNSEEAPIRDAADAPAELPSAPDERSDSAGTRAE